MYLRDFEILSFEVLLLHTRRPFCMKDMKIRLMALCTMSYDRFSIFTRSWMPGSCAKSRPETLGEGRMSRWLRTYRTLKQKYEVHFKCSKHVAVIILSLVENLLKIVSIMLLAQGDTGFWQVLLSNEILSRVLRFLTLSLTLSMLHDWNCITYSL